MRPNMDRTVRGTHGHFTSVGNYRLSYLSTRFSIDQLSNLETAREVLPRRLLDVEALMQREIDDERVRNEIVRYLHPKQSGVDAKFFPPILVAILDKSESSNIGISSLYPSQILEDNGDLPIRRDEEDNIDYLECYYGDSFAVRRPIADPDASILEGTLDYGTELKWQSDEVHLLVLDGQHRLMALKAAFDLLDDEDKIRGYRNTSLSETDRERLGIRSVPVCVIYPPALHEGNDNIEEGDEQENVIEIFRQIFVDVNRNAKTVSEARNILLNERDLTSEFTRSVIKSFTNVEYESEERVDQTIPLYCFEWNSPENKEYQINDKRAITSVGILDRCIKRVLLRSEEKPYKLGVFKDELGIEAGDNQIDPDVAERQGVSVSNISPTRFSSWQKTPIVDRFEHRWRDAIELVFRMPYPSKNLVASLEDERVGLAELVGTEEHNNYAKASLDYLLGSRSDQQKIEYISDSEDEWVGKYSSDACSRAVSKVENIIDDVYAEVKNGPFSRLFFSNLGQTEMTDFIYGMLMSNVEGGVSDPSRFGAAFINDFNEAFSDNPSNRLLFDQNQDWNSYVIYSLGTQKYKRKHIRGLLSASLCFFDEDCDTAEEFESHNRWNELRTHYLKKTIGSDDSYFRESISGRLSHEFKYHDEVVKHDKQADRDQARQRLVAEKLRDIFEDLFEFIDENGSPPPTLDESILN